MKKMPRSRIAQGAIAIMLAAALSACTGGGTGGGTAGRADTAGAFGSLPEASTTSKTGGTVTVALAPGLAPNYIFPNAPAASNGSIVASAQMYRPLYWTSSGAKPEINEDLSLAELPTFSEDRKTVTIKVKDSYKWSDAQPVVAEDLIFAIELIKAALQESAANWSYYTPGQFPDDLVSAKATSKDTVTLVLSNAYNPSFLTNSVLSRVVPLPSTSWNKSSDGGTALDYSNPENAKAIYDYLNTSSQDQKTFATNPLWQVVNGPFRLKTFDASTGAFTVVPNKEYTGPSPAKLDAIEFRAFTSSSAVFNQYRSGDLTLGQLDSANLSQVPALEAAGYHAYGLPKSGAVNSLFLNYKNTTNNFDKIIAQPYMRQALQHLIDQEGYVKSKGIYNGAAVPLYSTVSPDSPYAPTIGSKAPYPYSVDDAKKLLTEHGWDVVEQGKTTCVRPGTAPDQCGAGIPLGQDISFNLFYANSPATIGARNAAFVSEAKKVGINIEATAKATNFMYENYDNNFAPQNADAWAMQDAGPINLGGYPTAGLVFSTKGAFNGGSYSNETADKLMDESVFGTDPNALSKEATFLAQDLPVLFMPSPSGIVMWKKELSGNPDAFANVTQGVLTPEFWYYTK
ncbi:ABC transporter substrate-binding protein [Paenarthrobacter nitroguajacolicus]|uniref:ABC transporter substrate-binding protein n=1 Tax=Paenarthrobacter nitroguajacolicus TaxID=211146 RepID=UPI000AB36916|nr:ABC transporter substrate-binding protein [Paenarthrobacter nitroguajacolicus]